ncbi:MAG TPA: hypothetical protein DCY08_10560 [Bacteroides stercoris]|jgi:hypothetical protein|nr:hypothetical protein [Bacteroides stercoris]
MLSKKNINIEIGIIIPIYNAQSTLHKCINSVLIQSYTNFKLILINDGSKDDSENICQQYAENDKRIIVYSQNNSGVSTARNKGIELCTSPYLCFIDADDYLDAHYLQNFVEGIVAFPNVDMVFQGINRISTNHTEKIIPKAEIYPREKLLEGISDINQYSIFGYICTKMYRTEIIKRNQLSFNKNISISEDRIFALQYLKYCNGLSVISSSAYNYILHNNGLTAHKRSYQDIKQAADINLQCAQHLLTILQSQRFENDTKRMYIMSSFSYITALFTTYNSFKTQKTEISTFLSSYAKWLPTYTPTNSYYKFLKKVLEIFSNKVYVIVIILRLYWFSKKIKQNCNRNH